MRRYLVPLSLLVVLVISSCSKKEQTASTPTSEPAAPAAAPATVAPVPVPATASVPAATAPAAAAAPAGIATADGDKPGTTATVKELKRQSGGTVTLKFVLTNGTDKAMGIGYDFGEGTGDFGSIGAVQLIDPVGKKKYFVARDSDGKCVCSQGLKDIGKGESINLWAKFPAPPDDVQKISVVIPHFGPMDDVPISR